MAIRFKNLKAEQARKGYTNDQVAQFLGMSIGGLHHSSVYCSGSVCGGTVEI